MRRRKARTSDAGFTPGGLTRERDTPISHANTKRSRVPCAANREEPQHMPLPRSTQIGRITSLALVTAFGSFVSPSTSNACSLADWTNSGRSVVLGRNVDRLEIPPTDLWAMPVGIARAGSVQGEQLKWTSKYASLVGVAHNCQVNTGMNAKGLNWVPVSLRSNRRTFIRLTASAR